MFSDEIWAKINMTRIHGHCIDIAEVHTLWTNGHA